MTLSPSTLAVLPKGACRGCHKEILWVETEDGKKIPLDLKPAVYLIELGSDGKPAGVRRRSVAVTHFATCPDAHKFTKGAKKGEIDNLVQMANMVAVTLKDDEIQTAEQRQMWVERLSLALEPFPYDEKARVKP